MKEFHRGEKEIEIVGEPLTDRLWKERHVRFGKFRKTLRTA